MVGSLTCQLQTIKSFEESIRMYAIPAETASQNMPFQKEDLPGPGTSPLLNTALYAWRIELDFERSLQLG